MSDNIYYVYAYLDPRKNFRPFYIGKGKENRYKSHLKETEETTDNKFKFYTIQAIRKSGNEPKIIIIKSNLSEPEAYRIESALIAFYGRKAADPLGCLTNICIDNNPPNHSGKTWEEIYGEEKAFELRERAKNRTQPFKGLPWEEIYGEENAAARRINAKNRNKHTKGKTWEEIHGPEKASEIKSKVSEKLKGRKIEQTPARKRAAIERGKQLQNKSYEEIHGPEKALKIKAKLSEKASGRYKGVSWGERYGKEKADRIRNSSPLKGRTWDEIHGKEKADELRKKKAERDRKRRSSSC